MERQDRAKSAELKLPRQPAPTPKHTPKLTSPTDPFFSCRVSRGASATLCSERRKMGEAQFLDFLACSCAMPRCP